MGKFLELMENIVNGAPAALGFGAVRAPKVPSMALIALVSSRHAAGLKSAAEVAPEATILSGLKGPNALQELKAVLPKTPWGVRTEGLNESAAQAFREQGCDLLAFPLEDTPAAAVEDLEEAEVGRVLCLEPGMAEEELRAIDTLPVDALLVNMTGVTGQWMLRDLMTLGAISRRASKYILLAVAQPPAKKDLEALRDLGVRGLVLEVATTTPEALKELKAALLEMPRRRPQRKERTAALLPGSVYAAPHAAEAPEHEEEEEEEDE
jgi:hypothetical protein